MQASPPAQGRAWLWGQTTRQRAIRQGHPAASACQTAGVKAQESAVPLRLRLMAHPPPLQGEAFKGGGRSQSLPCKGRWQRVSDDGRVHCRPAPKVSCRVTPTQGGAAGRSYVCSSSLRRIFSSSSIWPMSIQQLSLMGYTPTFLPAARYRSITSGKPIFSPSCISSTTRGSTT